MPSTKMIFVRTVSLVAMLQLTSRVFANSEIQKICRAHCDHTSLFKIVTTFSGKSRSYVKPHEGCFDGKLELNLGGLGALAKPGGIGDLVMGGLGGIGDLIKFNYTISNFNGIAVDSFSYKLGGGLGCIVDEDGRNSIPMTPEGCSLGKGLVVVICNEANDDAYMVFILPSGPLGIADEECYAGISKKLKELGIEESEDVKKCTPQ